MSRNQQTPDPRSPADVLSPLPGRFGAALLSMYSGEDQLGSDGERHSLDESISIGPEQGMWLYQLCRDMKARKTLEIGLGYGYSTIYLLAAICDIAGQHTAVDPFQETWHGIGKNQARRLGMSDRFRLIENKSVPALVHFADQKEEFDIIFIDGGHRFDDIFLDFTLAAAVCPIGGYIVLDDMWMPAIRRTVAFVRSNRKDFEEITSPVTNMATFHRIGEDRREWNDYVPFFDAHDYYDLRRAIQGLTPESFRRARAIMQLLGPLD